MVSQQPVSFSCAVGFSSKRPMTANQITVLIITNSALPLSSVGLFIVFQLVALFFYDLQPFWIIVNTLVHLISSRSQQFTSKVAVKNSLHSSFLGNTVSE